LLSAGGVLFHHKEELWDVAESAFEMHIKVVAEVKSQIPTLREELCYEVIVDVQLELQIISFGEDQGAKLHFHPR
jgi:hypothetical protein